MNKKLAFELSNAYGISGFEKSINEKVKKHLSKNVDEFEQDNLGSIIGIKRGIDDGPKIMLSAHMDEIGFIIKKIDDQGYVSFSPVGGWWDQVLLGQRVKIVNKYGEEFIGVIGSTPPHVLPKDKRNEIVKIDDMFIDLGVRSKDELIAKNICVGDMIVPDSVAVDMINDDYILGKAWDNRIGCLLLIEVMEKLKEEQHPNIVYAVGSTQEEIGLKGAKTSSFKINPDVGIALDTGIGGDVPNFPASAAKHTLGEGPLYTVMDAGMIINPRFKQYIEEIAKENNIPVHPEIMTGGATDAGAMSLAHQGSISTCICIATRYIHSHNGVISKKDVDYARDLVIAMIKGLDKKKFLHIVNKEEE